MSYLDTNARSRKPTPNEQLVTTGRFTSFFGVFVGFVKGTDDVQKNGRLQVWIPEFGSTPENKDGWMTVNYCSPFAGATNVETIGKADIKNFDTTQTSYGMWMVPPDINNQVLVMFAAGDPARGYWIGSIYNQFTNNMVPGMAADQKNWQYPEKYIPIAEYNKWDTKVTLPDKAFKPYQKTKFKGVGNQGLITDQGRGITTSGARRESPSKVFGILTPGPAINENAAPADIRRKGGSSFIMDDGTGSEYIELATKTGAKVRIDETNGFVYIINRDGTSWIQMDQRGHIDIFSQFDISMRAMRDVNIRADRDINMEAGQNFYISAAKDTVYAGTKDIVYDINNVPKKLEVPWYKKCGRGLGQGGNIVMTSEWDTHSTIVQHNYYNTTLAVCKGTSAAADYKCGSAAPDGSQHFWSKNNILLDTYKNFHFWAHCVLPEPKTCYQSDSPAGHFYLKSESTFNLTVNKSICGPGEIRILADGKIGIKAPTITNEADVEIKGTLKVEEDVNFGANLGVLLDVTGNILNFNVSNAFHTGVMAGSGAGPVSGTGPPVVIAPPTGPSAPSAATKAEMKALLDAGDILPQICEPFFTRGMQSWPTTLTRWPTYEPCPLHETFKFSSTTGYTPQLTEGDKTYQGSGGAGSGRNPSSPPPVPNTDTGANNTALPAPSPTDSVVSKDINIKALECQLKRHEGVVFESYQDRTGLAAGVGHLLRANEIPLYPLGTPVSAEQVNTWLQQDMSTAIKTAQDFLGMDTWNKLDDNRKRAVADLAFNMGGGTLGKFKRFKAAMQAENYNAAGASLTESLWFTQVKSRGPKIVAQVVKGIDPNGCDKQFPAS